MSDPSSHEVTQLLQAWSDGNREALDELVPLVHEELHRLARHYMSGERLGRVNRVVYDVSSKPPSTIEWE